MKIIPFNGLSAAYKAALENEISDDEEQHHTAMDYDDDVPSHRIIMEGEPDRHAALAGIVACDHLNQHLGILNGLGIIFRDELSRGDPEGNFTLLTHRPSEANLVQSMRWTIEHRERVSGHVFEELMLAHGIEKAFGVLDNSRFSKGIDLLAGYVDVMKSEGVFEHLDPFPPTQN